MNKTNWKILGQENNPQISENNIWEEAKTLNFRDVDKGICEVCGISNHQGEEVIITTFAKGTENKSFCGDCLYNLPIEA